MEMKFDLLTNFILNYLFISMLIIRARIYMHLQDL